MIWSVKFLQKINITRRVTSGEFCLFILRQLLSLLLVSDRLVLTHAAGWYQGDGFFVSCWSHGLPNPEFSTNHITNYNEGSQILCLCTFELNNTPLFRSWVSWRFGDYFLQSTILYPIWSATSRSSLLTLIMDHDLKKVPN